MGDGCTFREKFQCRHEGKSQLAMRVTLFTLSALLTSTDWLAKMSHMTDHPLELLAFYPLTVFLFSSKVSRLDFTRLWLLHDLLSVNLTVKSCLVTWPQWGSLFLVTRVHGSHHRGMSPCLQNSVVGPSLSASQDEFFLCLLQSRTMLF